MIALDFWIPLSSSTPLGSRDIRSNQAGIWKPKKKKSVLNFKKISKSGVKPYIGRIWSLMQPGLPELRVTGMVAAVGQTILTWDSRTSAKVEAQPWPVSPNPCKKIRVAVCLPLADTMTGGLILVEVALKRGEDNNKSNWYWTTLQLPNCLYISWELGI